MQTYVKQYIYVHSPSYQEKPKMNELDIGEKMPRRANFAKFWRGGGGGHKILTPQGIFLENNPRHSKL